MGSDVVGEGIVSEDSGPNDVPTRVLPDDLLTGWFMDSGLRVETVDTTRGRVSRTNLDTSISVSEALTSQVCSKDHETSQCVSPNRCSTEDVVRGGGEAKDGITGSLRPLDNPYPSGEEW